MGTEYKSGHAAFDWLLEAVALGAVVTMFVLVAMNRGVKENLWLLPALGLMHYALLTALAILRLSPQHERDDVRGVRIRILTWVKAAMLASLAYILWNTIETALGRANGLESGFLPAMLLITVLPPVLIWRKMRSSR